MSAAYRSRDDWAPANNWSCARGISDITGNWRRPRPRGIARAGYMIVRRMPRWIILAILLLVVLGRSAVFILAPESYFDADQAIFGLMAKHLAEGRAFPLFMHGQSYILGVEAWTAAPLLMLAGPSAT